MEMAKTATVAVRIDPKLKAGAERIFKRLGLSPSQAVNLFFAQVSLRGGLPFGVRIPTADTLAAMKEAMRPATLASYESVEDFMDTWGQRSVRKKNQGNVTVSKGHAPGTSTGRRPRTPARHSRVSRPK